MIALWIIFVGLGLWALYLIVGDKRGWKDPWGGGTDDYWTD